LPLFGGLAWFWNRPQPPPLRQTLFEGVTYIRDPRRTPRPLILHIVRIDLNAPGIRLLVTPGDTRRNPPLKARTTSQFLKEYGLQVAMNGDYFFPFRSRHPMDYYPHVGDPVYVQGRAASQGAFYGIGKPEFPTLYLSKDNRLRFLYPDGPVWQAISGMCLLVSEGQESVPFREEGTPQPSTAVALDKEGRHLLLFVASGRQPNYSEGVTRRELARLILEYGGYTAMELDGGGSETLAIEGPDGQPQLLNTPMDGWIPGRERAVANHLGIYARR
jgi:hypothetical protein